jgi:asparagine synthase (glutamine-hydrolysing)
MNAPAILANFENAGRFSRKVWGLLSLELWHQIFHDRADRYRRMLAETPGEEMALAAGAGQ